MNKLHINIFLLLLLICFFKNSFACTDFRIIAKDKTVVVGRSLEFSEDLKSNIRTAPRGITITNKTPDGNPAMSWKSKYGYIYLDALNAPVALDGLNEKGLSFEYLYLPGETTYQTIPAQKSAQAIPYFRFGDWVLGNFATIEEVQRELTNIFVFSEKIAEFGDTIFPVHAAIYDATGKGIVIEFENGKMNVYPNDIGVMTNSPAYDWHLVNLRNYLDLSPYNPLPAIVNGIAFASTSQGSGMIGLPGDASPPSRFVKVAMLQATALPVETAEDAVNLAQHFMNTVDIPKGFVRSKQDKTDAVDITQWAVFKDLTHRVIYYRTYNDMTLRSLSLDKVNFAENAPLLKMPLVGKPFVFDVSEHFLKQNASENTTDKSGKLLNGRAVVTGDSIENKDAPKKELSKKDVS